MNNSKEFYYCYDKELMKFLRYEKGILFNCTALHHKTHDQFWQFPKSQQLYEAFQEYISQKPLKNRRYQNHGSNHGDTSTVTQ